MPFWRRVVLGLVLGAFAGLAGVAAIYPSRATVRLEMDRETPAFTSGLYDGERDGDMTFAWTAGRAVVRMAGLSRRVDWTCQASVRAARPGDKPSATVILAADASTASVAVPASGFATVSLDVPARADRNGLTVSLTTAPVFVPGGGDTRVLGVQVDWLQCAPASSWLIAPAWTFIAAAGSAAVFGGAAALSGLGLWAIVLVVLLVAAGTTELVVSGFGPFGAYPERLLWISTIAALAPLAFASLAEGARMMLGRQSPQARSEGAPLPGAWPLLLAGSLFALELGALSHPGKLLIDAVFQAHRLEWVLSGRYFFTQPLPDGVAFPYAIGLYVAASPFASLVSDHVFLVRITAVLAHALAALSLSWWVWRERHDIVGASAALVLAYAAPLVFVVTGNANLPNVFAQSVGTVAMVGVAWLWRTPRRAPAAAILAGVIAVACLSHVTTLAIVSALVAVAGVTMAVAGGANGRRVAFSLAAALAVALLVSWVLYYRHFPEVYERALSRVAATSTATNAPQPASGDKPAVLVRQLTWGEKAADAMRQLVADIGWPLLALALVGCWGLVRAGAPDRLVWLLGAWGVAWGLLLVAATLTRVDTAYQRYAAEFIGRINLAGYPAAAVAGALAVGTAFDRTRGVLWLRVIVAALAGAAGITTAVAWLNWFR